MIIKHLIKIISFSFIIIISINAAFAQTSNRQISLLHTEIKPEQLPYPGVNLTLSVAIANTKDSQLILKGYIVRDGKLLEITLGDVSQDQNERLVFSSTLAAPLAEMNYHFVLLGPKGVVASSKRYAVRRTCLPDVTGVDLNLAEDIEMKDKLIKLQSQASGLQDEVQNYEGVKKLLDELKIITES